MPPVAPCNHWHASTQRLQPSQTSVTSWWGAGRKTGGGETGETLVAVVGVRGGPGPEQPRLPASVGGEIPRGKHRELLTPLTLSETDTQPAAIQLRLEKEKKEDSRQLGLPVGLTCSKPSTLEAVGGSSSEIEWTNLYYGWPAHRTGAQDESDPAAVPPSSAPDHTRPDGQPQVSVHLSPCTPRRAAGSSFVCIHPPRPL